MHFHNIVPFVYHKIYIFYLQISYYMLSLSIQQVFNHFLGTSQVNNHSTHEYEGLNIDDRVNTTNAEGVYTLIGKNSNKTSGILIVNIFWCQRSI